MSEVIGWVSGGAASAVACKLGIAKYGLDAVRLAYDEASPELKPSLMTAAKIKHALHKRRQEQAA